MFKKVKNKKTTKKKREKILTTLHYCHIYTYSIEKYVSNLSNNQTRW